MRRMSRRRRKSSAEDGLHSRSSAMVLPRKFGGVSAGRMLLGIRTAMTCNTLNAVTLADVLDKTRHHKVDIVHLNVRKCYE